MNDLKQQRIQRKMLPPVSFEQAALLEIPELANRGEITNKEMDMIYLNHNCPWPKHITHAQNRIRPGVYKFSLDAEAFNDVAFTPAEPIIPETEEEMEIRIKERYKTMRVLLGSVAVNTINGVIIAGAPGLGKSFETNKILDENGVQFVFHRGYLKATHLFRLLWENRFAGQVIVLDDCDIWGDLTALNILKAALELKPTRPISWGSEKEFVDTDGESIPRTFDYEGSIVFLTNEKLGSLSSTKAGPHLAALDSRSMVLDLKIITPREIMCKVKMTVREEGMLRHGGIDHEAEEAILAFMEENANKMKEISLRTAEKIAVLYRMNPSDWGPLARTICLK